MYCRAETAEWLRRWTRDPMEIYREGSNPVGSKNLLQTFCLVLNANRVSQSDYVHPTTKI
jgi:hypothetical protein